MLPNTVPQSEIVFKQDLENRINKIDFKDKIHYCKNVAFELYSKYIAIESKFEINIDSDTRKYFMKYFNNKDIWLNNINLNQNELYSFFDDCRYEVSKSMIVSYTRMDSIKMSKIQAILRNNN